MAPSRESVSLDTWQGTYSVLYICAYNAAFVEMPGPVVEQYSWLGAGVRFCASGLLGRLWGHRHTHTHTLTCTLTRRAVPRPSLPPGPAGRSRSQRAGPPEGASPRVPAGGAGGEAAAGPAGARAAAGLPQPWAGCRRRAGWRRGCWSIWPPPSASSS